MIPVQSNDIDAIGYNEETKNLHIIFTNNSTTYLYKDIQIDIFIELLYSTKKDIFLKENILSKYEKIAV